MTAQPLGEYCLDLAGAATEAAAWTSENANLVRGELSGLQLELRRARRAFLQCSRAAGRKMCAGVFGPSQAGKSYLISALARSKTGCLMALFGETKYDFISEINPEGGKESTGLVTRFTMTRPDALPEGFPVRIRLLGETDIVKIIANTYYADCEHKEVPDTGAITAALDSLQSRQGAGAPHIDLDALEDLREYLFNAFQAKPRVQELERVYWQRALELGQKLTLNDRVNLYSLIWNGIPQFTELCRNLAGALEKLSFADNAFCPIEALIPRADSIIDVAMLEGLDEAGGPQLPVCTDSGAAVPLPRSVVAALTTELTITMNEKPDDYFDQTDLLDFPGYRSRYKLTDVQRELQKPGMTKELFLRGKVAYLFQRYCAERELTSMLLCIGPSNQEVQDLPGVINSWVLAAHGESPESRRDKPVALYFVLTKFDMEFEDKAGAPSVESRWDNRLHASLLDFFGKQHDWPTVWDGEHAFNNLFLLRNPNFKFKTALEYDGNNREIGVRRDAQKLVESLRDAFLNSSLVARHFKDPQKSWEAAMRLNDGGISHIRESLRPLCNPAIKQTQIRIALQDRCQKLFRRLAAFYKTDDREEERRQKEVFSVEIFSQFARLLQEQRTGQFFSCLVVWDQDLYDLYFEARRRFLMAEGDGESDEIQVNIGNSVDAADVLAELFGEAVPALPDQNGTAPRPPKKRLSEARYFTDLIIGSWCDKLRNFSDDPRALQEYGIPSHSLAKFVSELTVGLARLRIDEEMEKALQEAAAYANTAREHIVWQQVSRAGALLNNYMNWLGFSPKAQGPEKRAIVMHGGRHVLFEPPAPFDGYPALPEIQPPFEKTWCVDWMRAYYALMMDNVDFDGEQAFDREQNTRLGKILKKFDLLAMPLAG
ncbi:MAG: putative virulence factor [Desulfovibrio sp.]|nr:putative virulence factor [Desulfovibrio sp.]